MYMFASTRCFGAASQAARRQEAGLRAGCGEKDQSTLLSTTEAPYFDENYTFVATCICVCLLGHVFTCFPVGVACGVVAVVRAMWLVQCAVSAQARCHMCAAKQW